MRWISLIQIYNHTLAPSLLNAQSTVVDLGANKGRFLLELRDRFCCRCIGVEPEPTLYVKLSRLGIESYQVAVSSQDGWATFVVNENREASRLDVGALTSDASNIRVETKTFESLCLSAGIREVDLLKVDIEGEEIGVLKTMPESRLHLITQISIEFHDFVSVDVQSIKDVIKRLESLGFFWIRMSRHTYGDVWLLNTRKIQIGVLNRLYLKHVIRNVAGVKRILQRTNWPRKRR